MSDRISEGKVAKGHGINKSMGGTGVRRYRKSEGTGVQENISKA